MVDVGYIVKKIEDNTHPVFENYGLFSTKNWKKYDILGEYFGELCEYKNGDYLVGIDLEGYRGCCIDSEKTECYMKYINHYKNIGKPNCKYVSTIIEGNPKVFLVVIKEIKENEEILANYNFNI